MAATRVRSGRSNSFSTLALVGAVGLAACAGGNDPPGSGSRGKPAEAGGTGGPSGGSGGSPGAAGSGGAGGGTLGGAGGGGGAPSTGGRGVTPDGGRGGTPDGGAAGRGGGGPSDAATSSGGSDASTPRPAGPESYTAAMLSPGTGVRTDRRPISIGFHDARVKKTFVSWMGAGSDAIVKEFDHATGMWSPDKIAGNATYADKHNYPGLVRGADDHLYVFYGAHNTPLRMARSPSPLSIQGTWTDGNIDAAAGASYPAPVVTSDGTIYVFYRWTRRSNGHTDDRPYAFVKSKDNGKTWTRQMVIDPYPRPDNLTEIYNGKVTYQPARGEVKAKIHIAWTIAGGGPGTHGHATYGRNVYYAYLDPSNDQMYDVRSRELGPLIDNGEAEMYCKPLDTGCSNCGHQASLQVSVHHNDDGTPLILFGHLTNGLSSIRWNGSAWVQKVVTATKGEPRELSKFGPASFKAYRTGGNECQVFRTTDGGESWTPETTITAPHPVGRCHVIDNHHPDVKVFMEENPGGNGGDTSVAKVTTGYDPPYPAAAR